MTGSTDPATAAAVHILLVDDLPAKLLALQALLGDLGHHLVTAASGRDPGRDTWPTPGGAPV